MENLNDENNKNKLPKIFIVLRIIAFSLIIIGIVLFILSFTLNSEDNFGLGMGLRFGGISCIIISLFFLFIGFQNKIHKTLIKTNKYILQENKEELKDISSISGDIATPNVKKVTKAVVDTINENPDKKYCKHCGKEVDSDSKFCMHCGKEL